MKKQKTISQSSIAERLSKAKQEMNTNENETAVTNKKLDKKALVFVNGRLNRKKYKYLSKNLALLKKLSDEVNIYCKGIDLAVLNYLVHKGLEHVKKNQEIEVIDFFELEKLYES